MESIASMVMEGAALERKSWSESLAFAGRALAAPRRFGAILPSGTELCRVLARAGGGKTLVELGPGTGSITRHLLKGLPMDGRILALELDPGIAYLLQKRLPDPRLQVRIGDAGDLAQWLGSLGWGPADAVVSGLPFQNFPKEVRTRILTAARDALGSGGRFVAFQYGLRLLPEFRSVFRRVHVLGPVLKNLPPAYVVIGRP